MSLYVCVGLRGSVAKTSLSRPLDALATLSEAEGNRVNIWLISEMTKSPEKDYLTSLSYLRYTPLN
jgi:hypothetical protein